MIYHELVLQHPSTSSDDDKTSVRFEIEKGENWLRLLPKTPEGNSILDETQGTQLYETSSEYLSILSLKHVGALIEAPSKDCYICLDLDENVLAIKDMRMPKTFSSSSGDVEAKTQHLGIRRRSADVWEILPSRQLKILQVGDEVCISMAMDGLPKGRVMKYESREVMSQEKETVFLTPLMTQPVGEMDLDENDHKDEYHQTELQVLKEEEEQEKDDHDSEKTLDWEETDRPTNPVETVIPVATERASQDGPTGNESMALGFCTQPSSTFDTTMSLEDNPQDYSHVDAELEDEGKNSSTPIKALIADFMTQPEETEDKETELVETTQNEVVEQVKDKENEAPVPIVDVKVNDAKVNDKNLHVGDERNNQDSQPKALVDKIGQIHYSPTLCGETEDPSYMDEKDTSEKQTEKENVVDENSVCLLADSDEEMDVSPTKDSSHKAPALPPTIMEKDDEQEKDKSESAQGRNSEKADEKTLDGSVYEETITSYYEEETILTELSEKKGTRTSEFSYYEEETIEETIIDELSGKKGRRASDFSIYEEETIEETSQDDKEVVDEGSETELVQVENADRKEMEVEVNQKANEDQHCTDTVLRLPSENADSSVTRATSKQADEEDDEFTFRDEVSPASRQRPIKIREGKSYSRRTPSPLQAKQPATNEVIVLQKESAPKDTEILETPLPQKRKRQSPASKSLTDAVSEDETTEAVAPKRTREASTIPASPNESLDSSNTRKRTRQSSTITTPVSVARSTRSRHEAFEESASLRVVATGIELTNQQKNMIKRIGGILVTDAADATHVIAGSKDTAMRRTPKLMIGLCKTSNIVDLDWLIQSDKQRKVLPSTKFLIKDKQAEAQYNFDLRTSLMRAGKMRCSGKTLLDGYSVYCCNGVAGNKKKGNMTPPTKEFQMILEAAGAKWITSIPTKKDCSGVIILVSKVQAEAKRQLSTKKVRDALSRGSLTKTTEDIFHSIMVQQFVASK